MTAAELIELLQGVNPDTEVRLAQQPHWPFEYSVGEMVCVQVGGLEVGDAVTFKDDAGSERQGTVTKTTSDGLLITDENGELREVPFHQLAGYLELTDVLYIGEGTQLGYLPGVASCELGWR